MTRWLILRELPHNGTTIWAAGFLFEADTAAEAVKNATHDVPDHLAGRYAAVRAECVHTFDVAVERTTTRTVVVSPASTDSR